MQARMESNNIVQQIPVSDRKIDDDIVNHEAVNIPQVNNNNITNENIDLNIMNENIVLPDIFHNDISIEDQERQAINTRRDEIREFIMNRGIVYVAPTNN